MRHAVLAHGDFDFHAGVVNLAQNLGDASHRLTIEGRRLGQLDNHHLPCLGSASGGLGHQHVLPVTLVFGHNNPDPALLQQPTNDGLARSLHDFKHTPFRPALAIKTHNAGLDPVLVQHGAHFIRWQIDVGTTVITRHKSMAITMALHCSFNFIQQAAGLATIFDTISLFPEMPRWRNW